MTRWLAGLLCRITGEHRPVFYDGESWCALCQRTLRLDMES